MSFLKTLLFSQRFGHFPDESARKLLLAGLCRRRNFNLYTLIVRRLHRHYEPSPCFDLRMGSGKQTYIQPDKNASHDRQIRFCYTDKAIVLNNTEIEIASEIKYLGVIIDRKS